MSDADAFADALALAVIHAIADADAESDAHSFPHQPTADCDPDVCPYAEPDLHADDDPLADTAY